MGRMRLSACLESRSQTGGFPFAEAMTVGYERLAADPALLGWWTYLFVLTSDTILIGSGGFAGNPDKQGRLEIGYAIAPSYQKRGFGHRSCGGAYRVRISPSTCSNRARAHAARFQYFCASVAETRNAENWQRARSGRRRGLGVVDTPKRL